MNYAPLRRLLSAPGVAGYSDLCEQSGFPVRGMDPPTPSSWTVGAARTLMAGFQVSRRRLATAGGGFVNDKAGASGQSAPCAAPTRGESGHAEDHQTTRRR